MSRVWVVLGLLALLCGRADAQPSPWEREERTTAGWTFTPGASFGAVWDSGIQTDANPVVETLFQKWVGLVHPRAELDFNGRRTHLNFGYSGALEKYWSEGLHWEQRGRISARQTMTSRLSLTGDASYAAVPTTDRLQMVDSVVPYADVDSRWLSTGGGFSFRGGPRTSIYGNYRFTLVTLDHPEQAAVISELRDGYSHAPSLGFMRDFTTRLSIGANAEYRREYVGASSILLEEQFDVRSLTGEFTYRWSEAMSISGGGGVSQLDSVYTGITSTTPTFHGGFERRMRTFRINGNYSRGYEQLYGFGSLATSDTFSGGAFIPLADRLYYIDAVVNYTRSQPVLDLGTGFGLGTLWSNVAVGRQLAPRLRAEAFVSVATQSSAGPDSTNHTRIGIQLVTSKPLRIQ